MRSNGHRPCSRLFNEDWLRAGWRPYVRAAGPLRPLARRLPRPAPGRRLSGYDQHAEGLPGLLGRQRPPLPPVGRGAVRRRGEPEHDAQVQAGLPLVRRGPASPATRWKTWPSGPTGWRRGRVVRGLRSRTPRGNLASPAPAARLELVLSNQDYHVLCTPLQYGVDYGRMMKHLDRLETYMAAATRPSPGAELLENVRRDVRRGVQVAGRWKTLSLPHLVRGLRGFRPMSRVSVERPGDGRGGGRRRPGGLYIQGARLAAARRARHRGRRRPAFREVSLKYNPGLLKALARTVRRLKGERR